jgi:drug/metabolite transporter (DMT)-like permease
MKHTLTPRRWLVLISVMLTASVGDTLLGIGMKSAGPISVHHLGDLIRALANPTVICGIILLLGFMAGNLTALSWADLTFVLPATSFGYVVTAVLAHFWLHEYISPQRWLGIGCIIAGVGFVANGPSRTEHPEEHLSPVGPV